MYPFMQMLARGLAVLGGLVLFALILMTCLSIAGREINAFVASDFMQAAMPGLSERVLGFGVGQVKGDTELVEAGMAFAIFCFLPLCQITMGHASVDIFTSHLPDLVNRLVRMLAEVGFAVVFLLIAWKLGEGTLAKFRNGETTWFLQFPVWWAYGASLFAACLAALVAVYIGIMRVAEMVTGRTLLPEGPGVEH